MCSGKTKVGRLLAKKLGVPHFDTDEMIVQNVGVSIADVIKKQGEPAFREIEKRAIALVSEVPSCVISTGGGAPLDAKNMKSLSDNSYVIWLKVSPQSVLKRAGNIKSRPLIDSKDPLGSIQKRLMERQSVYAQASHTIETDSMGVDQVVDKILEWVPSLSS
jgi:shikimate kinase